MLVGTGAHAVMRIPRPSLDGAGPLGVDLHPAPRLAAGWAAAGGAKKVFRPSTDRGSRTPRKRRVSA